MPGTEHDLIYWVLHAMDSHGYNNVRGGYWQQSESFKNPPPVLGKYRKGKSMYNRCGRCGVYGHNILRCDVKKDGDGDILMTQ
jgi:hypothetical protein